MEKNVLSSKEISKKIKEYRETDDINIRNEVVENCLYLCDKVTKKYSEMYHVDYDELLSFAYEGLILSVEEYDETKCNNFFQYAGMQILGRILKGIPEIYRMGRNYFWRFKEIADQVEMTMGKSAFEDITALEQAITNFYKGDCYASSQVLPENLLNIVLINNPISYDTISDSIERKANRYNSLYNSEEESMINFVQSYYNEIGDVETQALITDDINNQLLKLLTKLPAKERMIIERTFGINTSRKYTQLEISRIIKCARSSVGPMTQKIISDIASKKYGKLDYIADLLPIESVDIYGKPKNNDYSLLRTKKN